MKYTEEQWNKIRQEFVGRKYGMLTVIRFVERRNTYDYFECKCECGNTITTRLDGLKTGHTKSCGCVREKWMHSGKLNKKHGLYEDRAYWLWTKVKARCYNPNSREYKNYGGRGIKMCDEWLDPKNFVEWCYSSGYDKDAPKGQCTIDRIDVNGDYEPSNCRWQTNLEQQNNRRDCRKFTYNGKTQTIAEWARELNIPYVTLNAGLVKYGKPLSYYVNDYTPRKRG